MAELGLKIALTFFGFFNLIVPEVFTFRTRNICTILTSICVNVRLSTDRRRWLNPARLKQRLHHAIYKPRSYLTELPYELRLQIYSEVLCPDSENKVPGALNLLLLNRQIHNEAKPIFDSIPHHIIIADKTRYAEDTVEYYGLPRVIHTSTNDIDWHLTSLKQLVVEVSVVSLGTMTPDCFDVNITREGKEQWRNLKRLIGIWPETRETPLESVRLDLNVSKIQGRTSSWKLYKADFIRVIRNFKRTRVWTEAGNCAAAKGNESVLLPLVKAFNQGRRNWVRESDEDHNLIVRYDKHMLSKAGLAAAVAEGQKQKDSSDDDEEGDGAEKHRLKWSVVPTDDTSRSDNSVWPKWTGKEESYIREKMIQRSRDTERDWECTVCLAAFDSPRQLKEHRRRGLSR